MTDASGEIINYKGWRIMTGYHSWDPFLLTHYLDTNYGSPAKGKRKTSSRRDGQKAFHYH
jgi:hypothetical protein